MARKRNPKNLPIGEQIRLMREERGLSQQQMIDASLGKDGSGLSKGGLSQIESAIRYPTLNTLQLVARTLKCTIVVEPKAVYIEDLIKS